MLGLWASFVTHVDTSLLCDGRTVSFQGKVVHYDLGEDGFLLINARGGNGADGGRGGDGGS